MELGKKEQEIFDVIQRDIIENKKPYSTLTNNQISKMLNLSPFSVRDKVISLRKKKKLQTVINYWTEDNSFYNRVILLVK